MGLEHYVLDPLADKFDDWLRVMSSLEGKKFKVLVNFKDSKPKSFETLQISNPYIIKEIWKLLKEASDLLANSPEKDVVDRVLIVPYKQKDALIIGYCKKRPTCILDLGKRKIVPIKLNSDNDQSVEIIFWQIDQIAVQLEYLRQQPYLNEAKIATLEKEIRQKLFACI